ncbi:hypothetical protein [Salipiger aestuarii]|uniref:hypothetical protein n=1 Tax=Salipiger aestuarii TaxID=568098 RepID=UPI001238C51F|nr:hypothetical protein [Salipiger aestuarii]KAA8606816.1 hypothetical protein AL037_19870 [Salipiger aestuarii]
MTEMRAGLVVEADASAIVRETKRSAEGLESVSREADKTAASFRKVETESRAATAMQERLNTTFNNFGSGSRSARDSAGAFQDAYRARDAYRALEESIDPLIRAERELAAAQKVVNQAVTAGVADQAEAARQMQVLQGRYDAVVAAQGRTARGRRGAMQGGIQNAAFQAQDIAVQLQMGTAASVVMAQQLPQLMGGFGMLGAVMGAVLAVGIPIASMLIDTGDAAGTLDERLQKLETSLQGVSDKLKILRDQDLELTFGSMAGDIREMTGALLELERAAELRNLSSALDGLMKERLEPTFFQRLSEAGRSTTLGGTFGTSGLDETRAMEDRLRAENYNEMTGGRGPDYQEFQKRRDEIVAMAEAGAIEEVIRSISSLVTDFADGGPVREINPDLAKMLNELGQSAISTADDEAFWNGTAKARRDDKATSEIVTAYEQQAELAASIAEHGEASAEVEAVRTRQAREVLSLRLRQLGIEEDSERAQSALAALEDAQAAAQSQRAAERSRAVADTLTGLQGELAVARAITSHGENSVEVERLRAEQAAEALRIRLAELGATEDQIARAEELLSLTRQAEQDAARSRATREAQQSLSAMQREAQIQAAILTHGRESLTVKRLQIDAAREAYAQSLAEKQISQDTRDALMAQWEAKSGLAAVDPFGSLAAAKSMLDAQAQTVAQLRLEQALLGQSEETRRRVLALYQAELDIRRQGLDVEGDLAARIRDGALSQSDFAAEVARQADAWDKVQGSAESAIDGMVDAAMNADIPGVFEAMAGEITGILNDLAIKNPLKNGLLGSDLPTLDDAGGLQGIWDRLTGNVQDIDPAQAAAHAAAQSVASMQVTAANVVISGAGIAQFAAAGIGAPANVGGAGGDWLSYANQGAVRDQPISAQMQQALSFLDEMGVRMEVFSGGQDSAGPDRVGSHRHDHGNAADAFFYKDGRRLDWANEEDRPIFEQIVGRARANGLTGFGAGSGYMQPGSMHLGYGTPAVWGAGGSGANAPDWLRQAYNAPVATPVDAMTQPLQKAAQGITALAGASTDATDGLGSVGTGFDAFGQMLSGLGGGAANSNGGGLLWTLASGIVGSMGFPGFDVGGATGGSNPGKVAGLVHEQEFVFDAGATARIGVANLEAIRRGRMPGYARGGYVSPAAGYAFLSEGASAAPAQGGGMNVEVHNYSGQPVEFEERADPKGGRQLSMTVGDQMARAMNQPGNAANKALKQRGVRQGVTKR